RSKRLQLQADRDALLRRLDDLDDEAATLATSRRALLDDLAALRDRLYPRLPTCHGRRPPVHDRPPLPPAHADADWVRGRALRRTALGVLARTGPLELPELHGALHL